MAVARASLVLVSLGIATVMAQPPSPASQPALFTTTIDVDGAMLRVRSSFAKGATVRGPVVVFETGAGIPLETWDQILVKVGAFAPVVAYDRPGTGKSPWDGQPLTPPHANQRLRKLLDAMGVPAPIVLVGHSWGGALARYFAGEYPQLVKAILYIDPTDVTMTEPMWQQMFASFGATARDLDAFFAVMDTSTKDLPPAVRAESMMMMQLLRTSTVEERQLKPAPEVPSSVLLASRIAPLPKGMVPFDGEAYARALQDARVTALPAWVKGNGRFLVVEGAGHFVYRDAPDVIVAEIERLMKAAPAR
jgi:pimeloyl-ACP methyl ester carboxylesterase